MTIKEIGERLVDLVKQGKNLDAIYELYGKDIASIEAADSPTGGGRVSEGVDAVKAKNEWWAANHEVHSSSVKGPFPHGEDRFAVIYTLDVTNKPSGQKFTMEEVALYTVADGKIVKEEFFYSMD
ncbi:MAG: nuclear transport factor 2 family protein [Gemmatimonadota bacterium]